MHRLIHRHLLLPAFESGLKRRNTFRYWRSLESSQWLPRSAIGAIQLQALQRLLVHAQANSPYYAQRWAEAGLDPARVESLEDFATWPTIDRATIAANRTAMRARGSRLISKSTGGSTGEPLQFDIDPVSNERRMAAWHRGYGWAGGAPGTRQFHVWGIPPRQSMGKARIKDALYNWLYRRHMVSCFDLSLARAREYLGQYNSSPPEVLVGYTSGLSQFAELILEQKLHVRPPRAVIAGAEKLFPWQRERIESCFGAPVFETYGSREFMLIGAECERHEGLHLTAEHLLVEILDDNGKPTPSGQEGNVVITDLHNFGMPFIRYFNGDRALAGWGACSCGRGLPLLKQVVGRRADVLETPDGRRVAGVFFPHLLRTFGCVRRFQAIQHELHHVELRVVLRKPLEARDRADLLRQVTDVLGPQVRFDLIEVNEIPLSAAGKHQVVVNRARKTGAVRVQT